jgi:hypothetical protein
MNEGQSYFMSSFLYVIHKNLHLLTHTSSGNWSFHRILFCNLLIKLINPKSEFLEAEIFMLYIMMCVTSILPVLGLVDKNQYQRHKSKSKFKYLRVCTSCYYCHKTKSRRNYHCTSILNHFIRSNTLTLRPKIHFQPIKMNLTNITHSLRVYIYKTFTTGSSK